MDNRKFQAAAIATPPAAEASPSTGYPTDGDSAGGVPATIPGAAWFHQIGEEMRGVIAGAGLTPSDADLTQLAQAIQVMIQSGQGMPSGTPLMWPVPVCPAWALTRDGSAVTRASYTDLFTALCPIRNGTTTAASNAVTGLATTTDLYIGMPVEGAGIPAGTTISGITSASAVTLSANATASATVPITLFYYGYGAAGNATTFGVPDDRGLSERGLDTGPAARDTSSITGTTTAASNAITGISSTIGLFIGQAISGDGVPGSSTIASITSGTAITISANATASGAVSLTVAGRQIGSYQADGIKSHYHTIPGQYGTASGAQFVVAYGAVNTSGNTATTAVGGPETKVKSRAYLPIIVY